MLYACRELTRIQDHLRACNEAKSRDIVIVSTRLQYKRPGLSGKLAPNETVVLAEGFPAPKQSCIWRPANLIGSTREYACRPSCSSSALPWEKHSKHSQEPCEPPRYFKRLRRLILGNWLRKHAQSHGQRRQEHKDLHSCSTETIKSEIQR